MNLELMPIYLIDFEKLKYLIQFHLLTSHSVHYIDGIIAITRLVREDIGVLVKFKSSLMESLVDEMEQFYIQDKVATSNHAHLNPTNK